jgi:SAM-dependent methyltransferase
MDLEQIKQRSRHVWGLGDYRGLSEVLEPAASELSDACAVSAGQEVLDVAAGDGNFALACAREGASVVATDIAPRMVERGRARTDEESWPVEWLEADAERLPFEDARFDCVGSVFGAFLAPRPEAVAAELFRVVRPGGTVGLTAWTPDGPTAAMFQVARKYSPPPPEGLPLPEEWGDEDTARARLDGLASSIQIERRSVPWRADSPEGFWDFCDRSAPTQQAQREALPPERYAQLREEFIEYARRFNSADDGSVLIESEYLLIVARRAG